MNFSSNLRKYRLRLGLTQKELAYKLGITQHAVSNYEAGIRSPKLDDLGKIAQALMIRADQLLK